MDPNATLREIKQLAAGIVTIADTADAPRLADLGIELAEKFLALNKWIASGGFLPNAWHCAAAALIAMEQNTENES